MVFKIIKIIALMLISFFGNRYILKMFVPTLKDKLLIKIAIIVTIPIVIYYIMFNGLIREGFEDSEIIETGSSKIVKEIEEKEVDDKELAELEVELMSDEELKALQSDVEQKMTEVMEEELSDVEIPERGDVGHNIPSSESAEQKIEISDQQTSIDLDHLAAERQADLERTGAPIQVDINSDIEPTEDGVMPGASEDIQAKYILLPMDQWMKPEIRGGDCFQPSIETWTENVLAY